MADLSKPVEAVDWAYSWLIGEKDRSMIRYSPGAAVRRITAAIAELSADPVQAQRCADSIAALRAILLAQEGK